MKYKLWIYGQPFTGKSYFASQFPKPFCINTDGNAQFYEDKCPYVVVKNFKEFEKALSELDVAKYQTLIIDVTEHIFDFSREHFLEKNGVDHESDMEWGKGWTLVREGFWLLISKIARLDLNVVLVSHEDSYEVKNRVGVVKTYFRPLLIEKLQSRVAGIMHFVGRCYLDGDGKNKISFGNLETELTGNRLPIKENVIDNTYKSFISNLG